MVQRFDGVLCSCLQVACGLNHLQLYKRENASHLIHITVFMCKCAYIYDKINFYTTVYSYIFAMYPVSSDKING